MAGRRSGDDRADSGYGDGDRSGPGDGSGDHSSDDDPSRDDHDDSHDDDRRHQPGADSRSDGDEDEIELVD